jgi:hypothetical protein
MSIKRNDAYLSEFHNVLNEVNIFTSHHDVNTETHVKAMK